MALLLKLGIIACFRLSGRDIAADRLEQATVVEPVDMA
jgi:hypothetical protein